MKFGGIIFLSIAWFGALTTSIVGTLRKVITMCYSIVHFGHVLVAQQYLGLGVTFAGLVVNLFRGNASELFFCKLCMVQPPAYLCGAAQDQDTAPLLQLTPTGPGGDERTIPGNDSFEVRRAHKGMTSREYMQWLRDTDPEKYRNKVEMMMTRLNISAQAEQELRDLKQDPTVPFNLVEDAVFRMLTQE